jgi:hypothetical protein
MREKEMIQEELQKRLAIAEARADKAERMAYKLADELANKCADLYPEDAPGDWWFVEDWLAWAEEKTK